MVLAAAQHYSIQQGIEQRKIKKRALICLFFSFCYTTLTASCSLIKLFFLKEIDFRVVHWTLEKEGKELKGMV